MAKKYDWGDGNGSIHSIPLSAHQANTAAAQTIGGAVHNGAGLGLGAAALPQPKASINTPKSGGAGAPAPAAAAGTPATTPVAAQIVPDAQYIADAVNRAFHNTTQINALTEEGTNDKTDTATTINRLIENAVKDRTSITEGAGKEGLFYSGQLTKRLGDYEQGLTRAQDDATHGLKERQDARDAAITAIKQGAPLDDAVGMAANADRQTARDTTAADLGGLVPNVNLGGSTQVGAIQSLLTPPKVAGSAAQPAAKYTVQQHATGEWHIYPDGHKVWVPKHR